jgi:hypothetical protein
MFRKISIALVAVVGTAALAYFGFGLRRRFSRRLAWEQLQALQLQQLRQLRPSWPQ